MYGTRLTEGREERRGLKAALGDMVSVPALAVVYLKSQRHSRDIYHNPPRSTYFPLKARAYLSLSFLLLFFHCVFVLLVDLADPFREIKNKGTRAGSLSIAKACVSPALLSILLLRCLSLAYVSRIRTYMYERDTFLLHFLY